MSLHESLNSRADIPRMSEWARSLSAFTVSAWGAVSVSDLQFLYDVIAEARPENFLEVGVATGLSSSFLGRFLELNGGKNYTGIDISDRFYGDPSLKLGFLIDELLPASFDPVQDQAKAHRLRCGSPARRPTGFRLSSVAGITASASADRYDSRASRSLRRRVDGASRSRLVGKTDSARWHGPQVPVRLPEERCDARRRRAWPEYLRVPFFRPAGTITPRLSPRRSRSVDGQPGDAARWLPQGRRADEAVLFRELISAFERAVDQSNQKFVAV